MRILVVDDEYVSRLKMKTMLSRYGDVDAVFNGEVALAMFRRAHEEMVPYDLITMDIDMPGTKGQEVTRAIREWERENHIVRVVGSEVKIVMASSLGDGKSIFSAFREGAEAFVRKPVSPESLAEALAQVGITA